MNNLVRKPSSESLDSVDGFPTRCQNVSHQQKSFLSTPVTQMIFFDQGMLLLGLNHFLNNNLNLNDDNSNSKNNNTKEIRKINLM